MEPETSQDENHYPNGSKCPRVKIAQNSYFLALLTYTPYPSRLFAGGFHSPVFSGCGFICFNILCSANGPIAATFSLQISGQSHFLPPFSLSSFRISAFLLPKILSRSSLNITSFSRSSSASSVSPFILFLSTSVARTI